MRVLGLDPSLTATGFAVLDEGSLIHFEVFKTNAKLPDIERFNELLEKVQSVIFMHSVKLVGIEGYAFNVKGNYTLRIAEALGIIKHWLFINDIRYLTVPPLTHKKNSTGKGNADKAYTVAAMQKRFPQLPDEHNIADAVSVALWVKKE